MPTAAFTTLGCKVNQYETQRIIDDFEERGFTITEFNQPADIYVINTCSVTQAAERKSRYMVRRVARQNPEALVVMTGCYGEMLAIKEEPAEEAVFVVANADKMNTLRRVLEAFPALSADIPPAGLNRAKSTGGSRTRATIKVQDGCNVFCSFCSIPYTRKVMYSRTPEELLAEAALRAARGYRELVVTGVLVGAYGQDGFHAIPGQDIPLVVHTNTGAREEHDLTEILLALCRVPGIERVRLSSIEPTQVTDRLLDAFASEPRLCPHLHIPLQSGDSGILRAMHRPYDQQFYLDRCTAATGRIADLAVTSDIMVGFPGEDRTAFESTMHVVDTVGFARAHIFRYSPRPGTPAAEYPNQVPDLLKEERGRELAARCRASQERFVRRFIGRELEVLVEAKELRAPTGEEDGASGNDGHQAVAVESQAVTRLLSGYTGNYIRTQFAGGSHLVGTLARVRLIEAASDGAVGEVGGAHFGAHEAPPDADFIPLATFNAALRQSMTTLDSRVSRLTNGGHHDIMTDELLPRTAGLPACGEPRKME